MEWLSVKRLAMLFNLRGKMEAHSYHISCPKICQQACCPYPKYLVVPPSGQTFSLSYPFHSVGQYNISSGSTTFGASEPRITYPRNKKRKVIILPVALTTQAATEQLLRALSGLARGICFKFVNLSRRIETGTNSSLDILDSLGSS